MTTLIAGFRHSQARFWQGELIPHWMPGGKIPEAVTLREAVLRIKHDKGSVDGIYIVGPAQSEEDLRLFTLFLDAAHRNGIECLFQSDLESIIKEHRL